MKWREGEKKRREEWREGKKEGRGGGKEGEAKQSGDQVTRFKIQLCPESELMVH